MDANVSGKPLQYFGEFQIGGAFHRNGFIIPIITSFPNHILELMLQIKQPNTSRGSEKQNRNLNK